MKSASSGDGRTVAVVGGGAAGFFGAIACAETSPESKVLVLEKGARFLEKVRISGGGRCNVTHACFEPRELVERYPRGEKELLSPYHRFQARDTVEWFEGRGVRLKAEADGRMFPTTDSSQTIIDCLIRSARKARVEMRTNTAVTSVRRSGDHFELELSEGETLMCDRLLLALGGCRTPLLGALATGLGHSLIPPVPSLFTFHVEAPWVRALAGVAVAQVQASVPGSSLREVGPLLFTHWGVSGPVVLRLSAWGARVLNERGYTFPLLLKWVTGDEGTLLKQLQSHGTRHGARQVKTVPFAGLPARLWEALIAATGLSVDTRWSNIAREAQRLLVRQLLGTELLVTGKSLNKDEFVTCGGVKLNEVNFKTMESRICPNLYFAGELLDVDGITGGFNFQAAWTTGWIAGRAMAA